MALPPKARDGEAPTWLVDVVEQHGVTSPVPKGELALLASKGLFQAGAPAFCTLTLVLSDDAELAELNEQHMGHEGPTDVLSFPLLPASAFPDHPGKSTPDPTTPLEPVYRIPEEQLTHLGDIVISVERAKEQAPGSLEDELRQLVVHGVLHICGWDHAAPVEREAMRALESKVLAS